MKEKNRTNYHLVISKDTVKMNMEKFVQRREESWQM
jgi:hypothetical protein